MKRIIKSLALVLVPAIILAGGAYAYLALTAHVDVETKEALTWVSEHEFNLSMYPGESETLNLVINNASSSNLDVALKSKVTPKLKGLTVVAPDSIVAVSGADTAFDVVVEASPSVEIGNVAIDIEFDR